jgi:hypothetical protein
MNALVGSKAKRNVASRGFMVTLVFCRDACARAENADGKQLSDFLVRGAPMLTGIAMGEIGVVFDR